MAKGADEGELARRLALHILRLRRKRGWSQEEAAYRCDLGVRGFQLVEHASINSSLRVLERIAHAFDVDARALMAPIAGKVERSGRPGRPAKPAAKRRGKPSPR